MSQTTLGHGSQPHWILHDPFMSLCVFPDVPEGRACGLSGYRTAVQPCLLGLGAGAGGGHEGPAQSHLTRLQGAQGPEWQVSHVLPCLSLVHPGGSLPSLEPQEAEFLSAVNTCRRRGLYTGSSPLELPTRVAVPCMPVAVLTCFLFTACSFSAYHPALSLGCCSVPRLLRAGGAGEGVRGGAGGSSKPVRRVWGPRCSSRPLDNPSEPCCSPTSSPVCARARARGGCRHRRPRVRGRETELGGLRRLLETTRLVQGYRMERRGLWF